MVFDDVMGTKPCIHTDHWTCLPEQRGTAKFYERLNEIGELHDRKQQDYGRPDDPFANIRASTAWGVPGWVGALIRAGDKLARLQKAASGATLQLESVRDSLLDLATYAVIALTMYDEGRGCSPGKAETPDAGPAGAPPSASKWLPWRDLPVGSVGTGGGVMLKDRTWVDSPIPPSPKSVTWWDDNVVG